MDRGCSKPQLRRMLRDRIAKAIPEGSGAEIKNLCDALYVLEGKGQPAQAGSTSPKALTVRFVGDAEDYSL
jgi:hypothetical protein